MSVLQFGRFRFDVASQRLDDELGPIRLDPKAFAVLAMLIERRGMLVTKDQLLDAVWRDSHVTESALKVCVAEIRAALGDAAAAPRFIETVRRRGYRFISTVETPAHDGARAPSFATSLVAWPALTPSQQRSRLGLVGRGAETTQLERHLARAVEGTRQVVFVTGEPGAGKTALLEHFVTSAAQAATLAVTGGQCLELFGAPHAYAPALEAVSCLMREGRAARPHLRRYAPTWFAQLPWLVEEHDRGRLSLELLGGSHERMPREVAEFVEILSREIPLVLVLEDVHWSDPSTVDLVSLLATREEPARLLLVASYRPTDPAFAHHPLRATVSALVAARRATEVALSELDTDAVAEYLTRRFPTNCFPFEMADQLRVRANGNPLFVVTLIEHLVDCGVIVVRDGSYQATADFRANILAMPETVRRLIDQQLSRFDRDDRELLESASLVGLTFSAAAAAAGASRSAEAAEVSCKRLAQAGPLVLREASTESPDGSVAGCYAFRHPLYREVLAGAVTPRRKKEAHLNIGRELARAYGERADELAAILAHHFEVGDDRARAAHFRRLAAEAEVRRYGFVAAESHLEKALELLGTLPPSPGRDHQELLVQSALGPVRFATRGDGAPEVVCCYERALELAGGAPPAAAFPILWGLWNIHFVHGENHRALELAKRNRAIADASGDSVLRLEAHQSLWATHFFRGEWAAMVHHLDHGEALYDPGDRHRYAVYRHDPKTSAMSFRCLLMWSVGRIDEALLIGREAVEHASALGDPMSLALALTFSAWLRHFRREVEACREEAEALIDYASEQFLRPWIPFGFELRGWALCEQGDPEGAIADLERGLELADTIGTRQGLSHFYANLAAAHARAGRFVEARELIELSKATIAAKGERYNEPDVRRLEAELLVAAAGGFEEADSETREQAERLLHAAIDCARSQGAATLELRAATSLARLLRRTPKAESARARLSELVGTFRQGFETADLREAVELAAR